jgi:hypothetical protein
METFRITTNMDLKHQWRTKRIIDGEASSAFGYLPSRTTSGALAQWLLRLLRRGPSLTLFEAGYNARSHPFPPSESPEVLQSLKIQTFVNQRNTLVHCWTTAECGLFRFGPHEKSYRVQFRDRPHKRLDPDLYLPQDGAIEHGYNFSPYNVLECVDPYSLVVSPTGSTGSFEFTDYRGLPCLSSSSITSTRRSRSRGCQVEAKAACPCRHMCGRYWTIGANRCKASISSGSQIFQLRQHDDHSPATCTILSS